MQTKDYFSTKFLYFLPISDIKPDHHRTVVDMTYKAAAEDGLQGTEDDGVYLRCCFLFLLLVLGTRGVGGCPLRCPRSARGRLSCIVPRLCITMLEATNAEGPPDTG